MTKGRNFDAAALTWDEEPRRVKLAGEIAAAIKAEVKLSPDWDGLDIGCGTGLVTLNLAPYLRSMLGVDSSCGMLDKLAEKVNVIGMTNVKTALCDLASGEMPSGTFHLITSAMTLHHIHDPAALLPRLKSLLYPEGWIAFADLDAEDGSFHDDPTGVYHHGFSRIELTGLLENAGYVSISVKQAAIIEKNDRTYPVLLAVAQA